MARIAKKNTTTVADDAQKKVDAINNRVFNIPVKLNPRFVNSCRTYAGCDEQGSSIYTGISQLPMFINKLSDKLGGVISYKAVNQQHVVTITMDGMTTTYIVTGVTDFLNQVEANNLLFFAMLLLRTDLVEIKKDATKLEDKG